MHFNTDEEQRVLLMLEPEHAQAAVEHAQTLDEASTLMLNRTVSYGVVWRRFGALSNLLNAARKVERLMESWWDEVGESFDIVGDDGKRVTRLPALHKDNLDDAFDAINYLAFFIQCARNANITGEPSLISSIDRERAEMVDRLRSLASDPELNMQGMEEELNKIADIMEQGVHK